MAQARSKGKSRKLELITYEELLENTSMRGLVSFLDVPADRTQVVTITSRGAVAPVVETTPVVDSAPEIETIPEVKLPPEIEATPGAETVPVGETDPGVETTPVVVYKPQLPRPAPSTGPTFTPQPRKPRIQACSNVRDGHSLGEDALYQALWDAAEGDQNDRTLTIGWRGMAKIARLTPKNSKINTSRLIEKLALEVISAESPAESIGRTYRIFGETALMERRAQAGLTHVVRTRGVQFVDPLTGVEKDLGLKNPRG